ncbi:MAG: carboxypeptidase regulatory-like domain-containing protein [Anaerolineae bacterium]|nr:carboxypeptidase regulatory-like domain-containing protein [Anaerolineae bacterium]
MAPGALVGLARTSPPGAAVELGADNSIASTACLRAVTRSAPATSTARTSCWPKVSPRRPLRSICSLRLHRRRRHLRRRHPAAAAAPSAAAATPPPPTLSVIHGLVQYVSGGPLAGAEVELHHDGLLETQTLSDSEGEFEFRDLGAGIYSVPAGILGVVHRDPGWPG